MKSTFLSVEGEISKMDLHMSHMSPESVQIDRWLSNTILKKGGLILQDFSENNWGGFMGGTRKCLWSTIIGTIQSYKIMAVDHCDNFGNCYFNQCSVFGAWNTTKEKGKNYAAAGGRGSWAGLWKLRIELWAEEEGEKTVRKGWKEGRREEWYHWYKYFFDIVKVTV